MTVADFSAFAVATTSVATKTSTGKYNIFPSIYLPHLPLRIPSKYGTLRSIARSSSGKVCMWFLFVRPEVSLRLPSPYRSPHPACLKLGLSPTSSTTGLAPARYCTCHAHLKKTPQKNSEALSGKIFELLFAEQRT